LGNNSSKRCVLEMLENPTLNEILLGLEVIDGDFQYRKDIFPCCEGEGRWYDEEQNTIHHCDLPKRFKRTKNLMIQYYRTWGSKYPQLPHVVSSRNSSAILNSLGNTLKGAAPQGTVVDGFLNQPSLFWPMALACTWRFGLDVHIVNMSNMKQQDLLPNIEKLQKDKPVAIFIEQVSKLWNSGVANNFETLVGFAYKTNSYLWVEFAQGRKDKSLADSVTVKKAFFRRIQNIKEKSPYELLDESCISKLKSMCSLPRVL
jgi:hypothetical protein